jgi:hypothetical protein
VLLATRESAAAETEQSTSAAGLVGRVPYGLIIFLTLVQMLQGAGEGAARTFSNVYLDTGLGVATHLIGVLASIGQLTAVPMAFATPLLIARWRNCPTFVRALLGTAFSLLPMAFILRLGVVSLGYVGVMAMSAVWRPPIQVYRMEIVSPRWRAGVTGRPDFA